MVTDKNREIARIGAFINAKKLAGRLRISQQFPPFRNAYNGSPGLFRWKRRTCSRTVRPWGSVVGPM